MAFLLLFMATFARADVLGNLELYRWNIGYAVQTTQAFQTEISLSELERWQRGEGQKGLAKNPQLFSGCYLAKFTPMAANGAPQWSRLCVTESDASRYVANP